MNYDGPASVGEGDSAQELRVQIVDVEDPAWVGTVPNQGEHDRVPAREFVITLTGDGIYAGWSGTARFTRSNSRLIGLASFVPPVGA
jgi:hypothetical protein